MRPLRWTVLATQVPPGGSLGGIVRYTTELITALGRRPDVEVSALTTRSAADTVGELVGDRARIAVVPDLPTPALSLLERHLPAAVLPHRPDVVHGMKHLVPHRSRSLRVLTVHDMLLLDRPQDFGAAKRLLLPRSYQGSIRDADLLLCVSRATRDRLEHHAPGSATRAEVVHLATSSSLRESTPRPVPDLVGRRFALVVGDPTPRKNLRTVVNAWQAVRRQDPEAVLAVAGPPSWGRTDVGALYQDLLDTGGIVALGHIDDAGLRWAYEHAEVVLCPSLAEGYGLPAAEALHFGAPVIISADPALAEASRGAARAVLPATDVDRWAAAAVEVFAGPPRGTTVTGSAAAASPDGRGWDEVADESVHAVRRLLDSGAIAR